MNQQQAAYDQLCLYTLGHRGSAFIHQHVVDAFAAQTAKQGDKPIGLTFALVGLYLHVERNFTGKQIQKSHRQLAQGNPEWPVFLLPSHRGTVTVDDVIAAPAGNQRDRMIDQWCVSVWNSFSNHKPRIEQLLTERKID